MLKSCRAGCCRRRSVGSPTVVLSAGDGPYARASDALDRREIASGSRRGESANRRVIRVGSIQEDGAGHERIASGDDVVDENEVAIRGPWFPSHSDRREVVAPRRPALGAGRCGQRSGAIEEREDFSTESSGDQLFGECEPGPVRVSPKGGAAGHRDENRIVGDETVQRGSRYQFEHSSGEELTHLHPCGGPCQSVVLELIDDVLRLLGVRARTSARIHEERPESKLRTRALHPRSAPRQRGSR